MTKSDIKFYDTCAMIALKDQMFENNFVISSVSLEELDKLKLTLSDAREVINLLNKFKTKYEVVIHTSEKEQIISSKGFQITNDLKILSDALYFEKNKKPDEMIFVTNDLNLQVIANLFLGEDCIESAVPAQDTYSGYLEICPTDEQLAALYQAPHINHFDLAINEYLIIRDAEDNIVDLLVWTGESHKPINSNSIASRQFGTLKPKDAYQKLLIDSFRRNEITLAGGKPGSGKTLLSLGYLFEQLEKDKIERIVVFCNPVVAKNAAKLGFYPGTVEEKLLSSQVGAILTSKIGSVTEVERMIQDERLILMPAGDSRGYEVPAHSGVYIMEAQNLDVVLLRMILQRIGENCITIVDGDRFEQTDLEIYSGDNNGMSKMSKIFRNHDFFGQVDLKTIYRSKIADLAEFMK